MSSIYQVNSDKVKRLELIENLNLLRGVIITSNGFRPSKMEIFKPSVYEDPLHVASSDIGRDDSVTVETETASQSFEQWWTKDSLSVSSPWVSASASVRLENNSMHSVERKTLYSSSYVTFLHGAIEFLPLEMATQLDDPFIQRVKDIVSSADSNAIKRQKLATVWNRYGHVFRLQVQVGATLMCNTSMTVESTSSVQEAKMDLEASLKVEVGSYGAGAEGGYHTDSKVSKTQGGKQVMFHYQANGGEVALIGSPYEWRKSTSDYSHWAVVKVDQTIPIVNLLPDDLRKQVVSVYAALDGKWVTTTYKALPAELQKNPDWFWLARPGISYDKEGQYLLVKERIPGSLDETRPVDIPIGAAAERYVFGNSIGIVTNLYPTNFVSLGLFFLENPIVDDDNLNLFSPLYRKLRTIRSELLVQGSDANPYWRFPKKEAAYVGGVIPQLDEDARPTGISTNHYAVYIEKDGQVLCPSGLWALDKDNIVFE